MSSKNIKRTRLIVTALISLLLLSGTIIAIMFAKGYRPSLNQKTINGTGLLAASSYPKQASVYINDKLTTTTDDTINLLPETYTIRITKEGFLPWEKTLKIQKELVTTTDARLFPSVPSLTAATFTGVSNPTPSPDGQKIAYIVTSADTANKNGIYILDTSNNPLGFQRQPSQISTTTSQYSLDNAKLLWSPDAKQLLLVFTNPDQTSITASYLLETNTLNNLNTLADVTVRLSFIFSEWEQEVAKHDSNLLKQLPDFVYNLATSSAINVYFSPDGEKMLYTATEDLTIPDDLVNQPPSINSTPQQRQIQKDHIYVYDLKEDTNYLITQSDQTTSPSDSDQPQTPSPIKSLLLYPQADSTSSALLPSDPDNQDTYTLLQQKKTPLETIAAFKAHYNPLYTNSPQWYTTSRHLITTKDSKITIFEYDNTNPSVVFSGPFDASFTQPSPNGNQLYILTNLNQTDDPSNLYSLDLK